MPKNYKESLKDNGLFHKTAHFKCLLLLILLSIFHGVSLSHGNTDVKKIYYSILLGKFENADVAENRVLQLKNMGHNAFSIQVKDKDNIQVKKVYIERFESIAEAEKEANILKELSLITDYTIEELMDQEQGAPALEKKSVPEGCSLQISSMKQKINAQEMVEKLIKAGYRSHYQQITIKDKGIWYRVFIDGYQSKSQAEKDATALKTSGLISGSTTKKGVESISSISEESLSKDSYFLHISSLKEAENAEKVVNSLTEKGLKAFFVKEAVSGEEWFRVYIGDFKSEDEARKKGTELRDKGFISYYKPTKINRSNIK